MISYNTSKTANDLSEIIDLQKNNLLQNLTKLEIQKFGFVTVSHTLKDLKKMHRFEQNVVIKDDAKIIGYFLAMTKKSKHDIPILFPMFRAFDSLLYKGKLISDYHYIVVGQVCIHKNYRGKGFFDSGYQYYKSLFKNRYDFAITEIATTNKRSLKAHKRVGFIEINSYLDDNNTEWSIVILDWKNKTP